MNFVFVLLFILSGFTVWAAEEEKSKPDITSLRVFAGGVPFSEVSNPTAEEVRFKPADRMDQSRVGRLLPSDRAFASGVSPNKRSNTLEDTDLGRAVIEGKPKAFETALWELEVFDKKNSLDNILKKTTEDGRNILDLFLETPEKSRSYFNSQLAYFMLHLSSYDTKMPPAQLSPLLDRARKAGNEEAVQYLSNLQKFYNAVERSSLQKTVSYLKAAKERYKGRMKSSVIIGIPAALVGYQLVYSSFGFDFTKEDIVNVVLPFITNKTVGAVVLAGAAAMGLRGLNNCGKFFSAKRQLKKMATP